jgi:hypothetical protein
MVLTAKRIALTSVILVYQKQTARNAKMGLTALIATIRAQMKIVPNLAVLGFMVIIATGDVIITAIFVNH